MISNYPQVSVVIPTYNRKQWVQSAIDSVLSQTGVSFECIVIDDGSKDGTTETLKQRYGDKIIYQYQENQGESVARNHGAEIAKGQYLAFLDSDDLWFKNKLSVQIQYLLNNPNISAVYCLAIGIDAAGKKIPRRPYGIYFPKGLLNLTYLLQNGLPLGGSTMMIRHADFDRVGGFDVSIRHGEDVDFCYQLLAQGLKVGLIKKPLTKIRSHSNSQSLLLQEKRFIAAYNDHKKICGKLMNRVSDENKKLIQKSLLRQNLRLFFFYLLLGDPFKAKKYHNAIVKVDHAYLHNSDNYYQEIFYFIPLIYSVNRQQQEVIKFIDLIFDERNLSDTHSQLIKDKLVYLKASTWCATRGNNNDLLSAWKLLFSMILNTTKIILKMDFWIQFFRLIGITFLIKARRR